MPKLILDASIVICWCEELEDPIVFDKLLEEGHELIIPKRVAEEVESDNSVAESIFRNAEKIECDDERHEELSNRFFRLGSGEKAVLAIGEEFENNGDLYYCVLDDGQAREACEKLGLALTGTIGLLGELIKNGLMDFDRADELIQIMKENGTRLPDDHTELLRKIV